jgi:hypothetical protein
MSFAGAGKLVTSLSAAQKAAKAANTFKTLAMIGKGTWAIMDVATLGMDLYMFGDELDKAINPNHDPQLKQLCKDVAALGLQYDPMMTKVVAANTSINNLSNGLNGLHNLYEDFEAKQGIAFEQLEKLGQLTEKLKKSAPTTYDWFSKTFFPKVDVNKEQFNKLQDRIQAWGSASLECSPFPASGQQEQAIKSGKIEIPLPIIILQTAHRMLQEKRNPETTTPNQPCLVAMFPRRGRKTAATLDLDSKPPENGHSKASTKS